MPAGWVSAAVAVYSAVTADDGGDGGGGGAQTADQAASLTAKIGKEQWDYYKQNYQPIEQHLIDQAFKANSTEEFDAQRGRANADVENAFRNIRKENEQRMQSYGINPGSPAYQNQMTSIGLAKGAANAGAQTAAYNNQKQLAYSKALDVVGIGRNIPAQSAASSANAAQAANSASQTQFLQNQQNTRNAGYAIQPFAKAVGGAAKSWYDNNYGGNDPNNSSYWGGSVPSYDSSYGYGSNSSGYTQPSSADVNAMANFSRGGKVNRLQRNGLKKKNIFTPHSRRFAEGGEVGLDASNIGALQGPGTETSDSIPAEIDGLQPAALSKNEFVINAEAVKMSGEEILQAINDAGLRKRDYSGTGLGEQNG